MRTLREKYLKRIIAEAISELQAFHGTGADFEKFNHKKYLSTGCGSQVYGWGTYVTTDIAIAQSYAGSAARKALNSENTESLINKIFNEIQNEYRTTGNGLYEILNDRKEEYLRKFFLLFDEKNANVEELAIYLDDMIKRATENGNNNLLQMYRLFKEIVKRIPNEESTAFVYEVDIPDDNRINYISWYERIKPEQMRRIYLGLLNLKPRLLDKISQSNYPFKMSIGSLAVHPDKEAMVDILMRDNGYGAFFSNDYYNNKKSGIDGETIYNRLSSLFKSPKAASLFLMQCGFDGIVYPTGTRWAKPEGAAEYAFNYVVFDANKVKIVKKELHTEKKYSY